jgi:hypothetical protein
MVTGLAKDLTKHLTFPGNANIVRAPLTSLGSHKTAATPACKRCQAKEILQDSKVIAETPKFI